MAVKKEIKWFNLMSLCEFPRNSLYNLNDPACPNSESEPVSLGKNLMTPQKLHFDNCEVMFDNSILFFPVTQNGCRWILWVLGHCNRSPQGKGAFAIEQVQSQGGPHQAAHPGREDRLPPFLLYTRTNSPFPFPHSPKGEWQ